MPLSVWAAGDRTVTVLNRTMTQGMRLATYVSDAATAHLIDRNGSIAGTVLVNGEPQSGRWVVLVYRETFKIVAATRSAEDGSFAFTELYEGGKYLALAMDSLNDAPTYNALVSDYLTPV
jgi:3-dehydroquinate synthase class II